MSKESKTVSAAVKTRDTDLKEDGEFWEVRCAAKFSSWAATLDQLSMDRSYVQYAATDIWTKMVKLTEKLEESQKSKDIFDGSDEGAVVGDASMGRRRQVEN